MDDGYYWTPDASPIKKKKTVEKSKKKPNSVDIGKDGKKGKLNSKLLNRKRSREMDVMESGKKAKKQKVPEMTSNNNKTSKAGTAKGNKVSKREEKNKENVPPNSSRKTSSKKIGESKKPNDSTQDKAKSRSKKIADSKSGDTTNTNSTGNEINPVTASQPETFDHAYEDPNWLGNEDDSGSVASGVLEEDYCFECGKSTMDCLGLNNVVLCDVCDGEYHLSCAGLEKLPRSTFVCHRCIEEQEQQKNLRFNVCEVFRVSLSFDITLLIAFKSHWIFFSE